MKHKSILTGIVLLLSFAAFAQGDYLLFAEKSTKTNNTGMIILGSWAVVNLTTGAYGWSKYDGQQKYFHQMNFFWNTVNLTISGLALYGNFNIDQALLSNSEIIGTHLKTEKVLMINAALDVGYIGTGFLLKQLSERYPKQNSLLKGYGNSLILQGAFLLGFDLCLYGIIRNLRLDFLNNLSLIISPEFSGFQLCLFR
jgi:hypothetical protein